MLKTKENVTRQKQATREPRIKTEWTYTNEVSPGFVRLVGLLLKKDKEVA